MDCEKYMSLMSEYMDNEILPEDRKLWEKHFNDCEPCKRYFLSFESGMELVQHAKHNGCPDAVKERLARFLAEKTNIPIDL